MRRLLRKVSIPNEISNQCVLDGTLARAIASNSQELCPEDVHVVHKQGARTGFVVRDLEDEAELPVIVEPWFLPRM